MRPRSRRVAVSGESRSPCSTVADSPKSSQEIGQLAGTLREKWSNSTARRFRSCAVHFGKGCVAGNVTSAFSLCLCFALRSCLADAAEIFCFEGINDLSSMHQKWSRSPTQTRRVSDRRCDMRLARQGCKGSTLPAVKLATSSPRC